MKTVVQDKVAINQRATASERLGVPLSNVVPLSFEGSGLTRQQASSLRVLKFAGRVQYAPQLRIKTAMIANLDKPAEDDEKAGVIDMLGRSLDVAAIDAIMAATERSNGEATRVAAADALGRIGASLHPHAHMRVDLGQQLVELYNARKGELDNLYQLEEDLKTTIRENDLPDPEQGEAWLASLAKREDSEKVLYAELKAIGRALGKVNTPHTQKLLNEEFSTLASGMEKRSFYLAQLVRNLAEAERKFKRDFERHHQLENRDGKKFDEIMEGLDPDKVRQLMDDIPVAGPTGTMATAKAIRDAIYVSTRLNTITSKTLFRLMDGLALQDDARAKNLVSQLLLFKEPTLTAKALDILGPKGGLDYSSEIARFLESRSPELRRAAIKALRYSSEPAAKEKLMDYLSVDKYFDATLSDKPTYEEFMDQFDEYVALLMHLAVHSNDYIMQLNDRVLGKDYDESSRRIAMMVMSFTFDKYMKRNVSPTVHSIVTQSFKNIANNAMGRDPESATGLAVWASQLLMDIKEFEGFQVAASMLSQPAYYLSDNHKERLLYSAFRSMQEDHSKVRQDDPDPDSPFSDRPTLSATDALKQQVLSTFLDEGVDAEPAGKLRDFALRMTSELGEPDLLTALNYGSDQDGELEKALGMAFKRDVVDTEYVQQFKAQAEKLRPLLLHFLEDEEDEGTLATRLLAGRILGYMEDQESVDSLMTFVEDPFKGKINWRQKWGFRYGFEMGKISWLMRYQGALALGDIGDAKALDLMLNLLDDPFMNYKHLGGREVGTLLGAKAPIGQMADDLHKKLQVARAGLEAAQQPPEEKPDAGADADVDETIAQPVAQDEAAGAESEAGDPEALRAQLVEQFQAQVGSLESQLERVHQKLRYVMDNPNNDRKYRTIRINAANTVMQFEDGVEQVKDYIDTTDEPNFKRQAASALISNDYALESEHADHHYVEGLLTPGLNVEKLHAKGITGKGVDMAIVDGGYVYGNNPEGFQDRVKLPPNGIEETENTHPTMVMTTAAGNGVLKGVAPEARVISDRWPTNIGEDAQDRFKKIIAAKLRGENNVVVINNSWGFTFQEVLMYKPLRESLKEFRKVVAAAEAADINMVFSAGNSGEEHGLPGVGTLGIHGLDVEKLSNEERDDLDYILDKVILVGASNTQGLDGHENHVLTDFSSRGDAANSKFKPTVVAPGADMMVYSYDKKQLTKQLVNGTSFSGPFTSGLIADLAQVDARLTAADRREILKQTAVMLPHYSATLQGHGEVDPEAAVALAKVYRKQQKQAQKG